MKRFKKDDAVRRVVIEFVNDDKGLFLHSAIRGDQLNMVVGGVSIGRSVVEASLVRCITLMVRTHLKLKLFTRQHESKLDRLPPHGHADQQPAAADPGGLGRKTSP